MKLPVAQTSELEANDSTNEASPAIVGSAAASRAGLKLGIVRLGRAGGKVRHFFI